MFEIPVHKAMLAYTMADMSGPLLGAYAGRCVCDMAVSPLVAFLNRRW